MKWIFFVLTVLMTLPFLVKLCYMLFILYRHYFFGVLNSKYLISHQFLSKMKKEEPGEQQGKRIGFDISFTEEDKQKLEARETRKGLECNEE
jgi:alpha-N-acetylglucosamine transferase